MLEASIQVWLGLIILISGVSMARMGPAFKRSQFGFPLFFLGILLMIIQPSEVVGTEAIVVEAMRDASIWMFIASLGIILALIGAPKYWKVRPAQLISGWIIIGISWVLYAENNAPSGIKEALIPLAIVPGIVLTVAFFAWVVREVEIRIPPEDPAEELTEREKAFVRSVILRNMRGEEE